MNIDDLITDIEAKKCILLLGPDIAFNNKKSLLKELSNFLKTERFEHQFHNDEELFSSKTKFIPQGFRKFPRFFEKLEQNTIYQKIAEIPFHFIISLSPDLLLKQTFENNNFDYSFDYYHKGKAPQSIKEENKPSKEKPFLYNLLGQYTETTSLVLTFNNLFDYLSSILGVKQLHDDFKIEIEEAYTVFFLGFKYDKWYLKLIMRLLNKDDNILQQASIKEIQNKEKIINFYEKEFQFEFENQLSGEEIIDKIHKYFTEKNSLRKPKLIKETQGNVTINVTDSQNINILNDINANKIDINK